MSGPVTINHFVPLIPNNKPCTGEATVVLDAAPTRVMSADCIIKDASKSPSLDESPVLEDSNDDDDPPHAKVIKCDKDTGSIGNGKRCGLWWSAVVCGFQTYPSGTVPKETVQPSVRWICVPTKIVSAMPAKLNS